MILPYHLIIALAQVKPEPNAANTTKSPLFTFPSDNPQVKIDYVMYYPENRWRVLKTEVIQDTVASDHCAYLVTIELLDN